MIDKNNVENSLSYLSHKIKDNQYQVADFLGFYHENCLSTITLLFLEEKGCKMYGKSLEEIQKIGPEFLMEIMHPEDIERCVTQLTEFALRQDENEVLTYIQRLRLVDNEDYKPYFTCAKLNLSKNIFQCITTPMTGVNEFKGEINHILEKSTYIDNHVTLYTSFSSREREVITLVCKGKTVKEIANQLFLSPHTIEKHKKNIYKKSKFNSNAELIEFALNFNLI